MSRASREASRIEDLPLRSELFSIAQLERHAQTLPGARPRGASSGLDRLLPRLDDNERVLADAYALVAEAVSLGRQITPAAEWFIDNYHLIEEQIRIARQHLPRGYSRELPRLDGGSGDHTPRVYHLAIELISHSHGRVDLDALSAFISSYQAVHPLLIGELWAIPIMLRIALIENLRRVITRVAAGRRDREAAGRWADKLLDTAADDPTQRVVKLAALVADDPPLTHAFVSELASRLQGHGAASTFPLAWLEQRLGEQGLTIEHSFHLASQSQAADQVSIGNSIGSLRFLGATDWRDFVEGMSVLERSLRTDPAAIYPAMDFPTRDRYRHVVERIAKREHLAEQVVAQRAVELANEQSSPRMRHVGYFLVDAGRRALERALRQKPYADALSERPRPRSLLPLYAGAIVGLTALVAVAAISRVWTADITTSMFVTWSIAVALCSSQLAVAIVQWASTLLVAPRVLPRLEFAEGIPSEHRTIVAVPTMLTSIATINELVDALEVRFLANRDANLGFALLGDFRDAAAEHLDGDAALLRHAAAAIDALNAKYPDRARGGGFFLFHRARRWNPREGVWMGWERKRGKLEDFNAQLRGETGRFATIVGPIERLANIKYVIALDSDTELPRDCARSLAGTIAHPLNRPVFDEALGRVTHGYAILQPRVGISLASASSSRFARLFAGDCGIDPYTRAVSDVYQDVFGEGSFVGKGIYDIDAVRQATHERLPENRVLSHDLLEGAYGRAGLVSDLLLVEDYPTAYAADASRRARWIRGDWQIARWLMRRVPCAGSRSIRNPISLLSQWKIGDNLRRSLVPLALVAVIVIAWWAPVLAPSTFLLVVGTLLLPGLVPAASSLARRSKPTPRGQHAGEVATQLGQHITREAFTLATLPFDAWVSATEIVRATTRTVFTRKKLLEWKTAADAQRALRTSFAGTHASLWIAPATAAAIGIAIAAHRPERLWVAGPVLALWMLAPALVWWLGHPVDEPRADLKPNDRAFLRSLARRTWRFFETYVTAESNDLAPDNVQEDPPVGIAHRTSPTNIGLQLLSNLAAYDFGYVSVGEVAARTRRTFATLDRLQRHRGHFYNWYDTRTLEPLRPMYVSTVDSGNLAGCLMTLASGLTALADDRVVRAGLFAGLADTLDVLEDVGGATAELAPMRALLTPVPTTMRLARDSLRQLVAASELLATSPWADAFAAQCRRAQADLEHVAPWLALATPPGTIDRELVETVDRIPTLVQLAQLETTLAPLFERAASAGDHADWLAQLRAATTLGATRATQLLTELRVLADRCGALSDYDYELLYDRGRDLLSIGFNVVDHRLDASFYDLLASEARLASYVAIAQGKLPQEHWFRLGRQLTTSGRRPALLSWSGSMFEYLMPLLVMPTYDGTLLDTTYQVAVARQIEYGREHGVPWGVSESGYNKVDAHLNYQYRAFGVPGLGFKRGLADDLVIAPYAGVMALMVKPAAAAENLRRLRAEHQLGGYGFYEAIDYTASRMPPGKDCVTVRSYMAHHQGMSLLALTYALLDRPMQRRFSADPALRATDLLLQERVPRTPIVYPHPAEVTAVRTSSNDGETELRVVPTPHTPAPELRLLSNGNYHVAVTNAGGGYSRLRELAVTRWHEDATRDCWGQFCYLRDVTTGSFWSVTHQPTLRPATSYEAIFSPGRVEFRRRDEDIDTHVEISVCTEDDIELRRITLTNFGQTKRTIEITSYAEVVLTTAAADAAHRAFSNLFVQTELLPDKQAILCTRRPRSNGEQPPWLVHLMTVHGATVLPTSYETDRAAFIGRGQSAVDPAAMHRAELSNSSGSVLDPIVAIRNTVELGPDETIQLHLVTGVVETRVAALGVIDKYGDRPAAQRIFELAWTQSQVVHRRLEITTSEALLWERLAGNIIYLNPAMRAPSAVLASNTRGQSALWAYGISGDLPIVLVRISSIENLDLVRQLIRAHAYFRLKGLVVDLVIWNEDPSGYRQDLHEQILAAVASHGEAGLVDRPGGIFLRRSDQMTGEDCVLMQSIARVIFDDSAGTFAEQMERRIRLASAAPLLASRDSRPIEPPATAPLAPVAPIDRPDLSAFNGHGGFTHDGKEYVITTHHASSTPAPWVNVLANPYFGSVISESGAAYTWCENAHSYRLTPWSNDPVSDPSGEAFYLRDEDDGRFWSPTPAPAIGKQPYTTRHGFGYTVFETAESGISSSLRTFIATDAPIKFMVLELKNRSGRRRKLSLTGFFELVLGSQRTATLPHVVTELDIKTGALFANNPYSGEFVPRVAFLECSEDQRFVTGDWLEFIGRNGTFARPAAMTRARLSGRVGAD
ncbi:MAG: glucoamylase family protein, partial [Kofleriaceae bacterium]